MGGISERVISTDSEPKDHDKTLYNKRLRNREYSQFISLAGQCGNLVMGRLSGQAAPSETCKHIAGFSSGQKASALISLDICCATRQTLTWR
ncbi:hypothetical protein [Roseinatronobacter sp.]|uniref:hypothetical protein n=1 Tax=Roseinatronobacter sp. TaxID=1945755 RepID=UPI0025CDDE33|nr:hypothetical protein [Roseibaca sp.]